MAHLSNTATTYRDIQILKGCMRETETDRVWACSKMPMNRLHHLRSKYVPRACRHV
jgi:ABC-type arginine/histidine transport system permease subunit